MLEARVRAPTTKQRDVFRARIVLLASEGQSTRSIARTLKTMPRTVSTWRGRFAREGLAGLAERPRPGPAPKYTRETGDAPFDEIAPLVCFAIVFDCRLTI